MVAYPIHTLTQLNLKTTKTVNSLQSSRDCTVAQLRIALCHDTCLKFSMWPISQPQGPSMDHMHISVTVTVMPGRLEEGMGAKCLAQ